LIAGWPNLSLNDQSRRNPDGAGIGWFDSAGRPRLDRAPVAALDDPAFADDARRVRSSAVLAHVRHSSGTVRRLANTMPFERDGRLFAHNGAFGDLPRVEQLAGRWADGLAGDTDSERYLSLITRRAAERGDLAGGLVAAAAELAAQVPVLSLNCIVLTPDELVACATPRLTRCGCWSVPPARGWRAPAPMAQSGSSGTDPTTPTSWSAVSRSTATRAGGRSNPVSCCTSTLT